MKKKLSAFIITISLCTALAFPVGLAAQDKQSQTHRPHHYKLIDIGTLGGPSSYIESIPPENIINLQGSAAGYADTSAPDPYYPNCFTFNLEDCVVNHAFVWQGGVVTDLGSLPGGYSSYAASINARGEIAGASQNGQIDPLTAYPEIIAVLWKNGIIDLGTLGGNQSVANATNDRGQVAGAALNAIPDPFANSPLCTGCGTFAQTFLFVPAATQAHAFRWTEAAGMQDLGALGGPDSSASFVNQRGQIGGEFFTSFTPNPSTGVPTLDPFFWENGTMVDIGTLGGTLGYPNWMNNSGQVVGFSNLAGDQASHAFLWDKDRKERLKDLGTLYGGSSFATFINDDSEVVGSSSTLTGYHTFLWKNGAMTDLGSLGSDPCSFANWINSPGQIVGNSSPDCIQDGRGFLWENGGPMLDLNSLVPPGSALTLITAVFINDRGEIAARGKLSNGDEHAVALIPCDESHPGVEGCDYSLVEADTAVPQASPVVRNTASRTLPQLLNRRMNRHRLPGPAIGPIN
jgi:probable HAF family extracellular repeat protein